MLSTPHVYLQRPEEGDRSPGTRVMDSCEIPCGCWELNPGLLEEQPVLLTFELSLHLIVFVLDKFPCIPGWPGTHSVVKNDPRLLVLLNLF